MNFKFHPEAERELYEAASRYESEVSELGFRFVDEVERVTVAHGSREPGYWRLRVQDR